MILKFWLNVSQEEQRERFLARIDEPEKNWKFSAGDVAEREHWDDYMQAYEEALNATSRPWAPWYAIPADDKPFMRWMVAASCGRRSKRLPLAWPEADEDETGGSWRRCERGSCSPLARDFLFSPQALQELGQPPPGLCERRDGGPSTSRVRASGCPPRPVDQSTVKGMRAIRSRIRV